MEEVPAHVIDFWLAFDAVEPIGDQWRQTAETNAMLSNLIAYQAASMGIKIEPATAEDNMPARYEPVKKRPAPTQVETNPQTEFQRVAAAFGLTEIVKKHGRINQPS